MIGKRDFPSSHFANYNFTLTCGNNSANNTKYSLGQSVETDILRFTLLNAQLAIKVNSTSTYNYDSKTQQAYNVKITDDYFTADEYNAEEDAGTAYVAAKGHTYVVMEFEAENLDRAGVEFDGTFNTQFIVIDYAEKTYSEETTYGCSSTDGINWEKYNSSNILLLAGKKERYRCFVDIPTDANSLTDDFEITFALPKSDGKTEKFSYYITASDVETVANQEISLEHAIERFTEAESLEYFNNHMNEFAPISGDEIKSAISFKPKWNVDIKESVGSWSGQFQFEDSGRIKETHELIGTGYFNNRMWSINGNEIILKSDKNQKTLTVRKVSNNVYLFVDSNTPYMLIH